MKAAEFIELWGMSFVEGETTGLREREKCSLDFSTEFSGVAHAAPGWQWSFRFRKCRRGIGCRQPLLDQWPGWVSPWLPPWLPGQLSAVQTLMENGRKPGEIMFAFRRQIFLAAKVLLVVLRVQPLVTIVFLGKSIALFIERLVRQLAVAACQQEVRAGSSSLDHGLNGFRLLPQVNRARPTLDEAPLQKQANVCGAVLFWLILRKKITAVVPARIIVFHGCARPS